MSEIMLSLAYLITSMAVIYMTIRTRNFMRDILGIVSADLEFSQKMGERYLQQIKELLEEERKPVPKPEPQIEDTYREIEKFARGFYKPSTSEALEEKKGWSAERRRRFEANKRQKERRKRARENKPVNPIDIQKSLIRPGDVIIQ